MGVQQELGPAGGTLLRQVLMGQAAHRGGQRSAIAHQLDRVRVGVGLDRAGERVDGRQADEAEEANPQRQ